jgi:dGTPase
VVEQLHIREFTEAREQSFAPCAIKSKDSLGRQRPLEPDPIRTCFQRDRDRIIHCKSFRRLKHKTQVFIAPAGDHYVTRLTHTLEVSQIARTIARALNMNEDLTEAISLGHDLGHTPFGHLGEDTLNELFSEGFRHNEQSLRMVDLLENEGQGLNLTWEVRNGIVSHSKSKKPVMGEDWGEAGTLEGEIVKISDMVAYINHDIGDAVRAGILTEKDLPLEAVKALGNTHSVRINTMVSDIIKSSWEARTALAKSKNMIRMSPPVLAAANIMRDFLFDKVYIPSSKNADAVKAQKAVILLWKYFIKHEKELPAEIRLLNDTKERGVADYIAGMTDQYALRLAKLIQRRTDK